MRLIPIIQTSRLLLLAGVVFAQESVSPYSPDSQFIRNALKSGKAEIETAQLAARMSTRADVKKFAEAVAADHQKAHAQLTEIGQRAGVTESPSAKTASSKTADTKTPNALPTQSGTVPNTPEHATDATAETGKVIGRTDTSKEGAADIQGRLKGLTGAQFDREFLNGQVEHHRREIADFESCSKTAKNQALREFVTNQIPALKKHLAEAQQLAATNAP